MVEVKEYKYKKNIFLCVIPGTKKEITDKIDESKTYLGDTEYQKYALQAFESLMEDLRHIKYLGKDEILGPAVKNGEIADIVTYSPEPDTRSRSFWMFGVYSPDGDKISLEEAISKYEELVKKKANLRK